jgi:hypothetical protein
MIYEVAGRGRAPANHIDRKVVLVDAGIVAVEHVGGEAVAVVVAEDP